MTHSLRPVCNSLFYEDVGQSRTDHEIHFFFFFFLKRECGEGERIGVTPAGGRKNGGAMRVGGGGDAERGAHVEDITAWVKAQSLFMVRFVRGSRWS